MKEISRIGVDTSKQVFQLHGVDAQEKVVLRQQLRRGELERFFARLPRAVIGLEACGASHHWARRLTALGHEVKLLPPQYVKPYVKRSKSDKADAEAICEAMSRPSMRYVPIKSEAQQAGTMILRVREQLIKQRTQLVNAIRGHAAEFGVTGARGVGRVKDVLEAAKEALPELALALLSTLAGVLEAVDAQLKRIDAQLLAWHRGSEISRRIAGIPGIGPISAMTLLLRVPDPKVFRSARHFAAWTGLEHRTEKCAAVFG